MLLIQGFYRQSVILGKPIQEGMFVLLAFHELAMIYTGFGSKVTHLPLPYWLIIRKPAQRKVPAGGAAR
jgi:hypothetical protein